jgi:hypothetical protein
MRYLAAANAASGNPKIESTDVRTTYLYSYKKPVARQRVITEEGIFGESYLAGHIAKAIPVS